jgi:hypothetical protein
MSWHEDDPDDRDLPDPADLADDGPEADQVVCPACGAWVFDDTEQCPHCGDWIVPRLSTSVATRRVWLILALVVIAGLVMITVGWRWS